MAVSGQRLLQVLKSAGRPLGLHELLRQSGMHPAQQTELKRALKGLLRQGELRKEGKRFGLFKAEASKHLTQSKGAKSKGRSTEGTLHVNPAGFGFVHPTSGEGENIYLPPHEVRRAMDNDVVRVEIKQGGRRSEGRLLEVVERRRTQAVGVYVRRGNKAEVVPNDPAVPGPIQVLPTQMAQDGDLVRVQLGVGGGLLEAEEGLYGEVAGSLGKPGEPSGEILGIAFSEGFSDLFSPEVMNEADKIRPQVEDDEWKAEGRKDLRNLPLVTIDGEDARDFDDAVYAEKTGQGHRLWVAIADVSHYVRPGTELDREAFARATSVYLPGRVLPMLPERLSAGICSLKPNEDRLCMVCEMEIDRAGLLGSWQLYPAVMRSAARCTYNEVQSVLDGKDVPHRNAFRSQFKLLLELAHALNQMRQKRGAIDFDLPELKVVLGSDGLPARLEKRERLAAHRLIEECMLVANEAVARSFQELGLPSIYRFHGSPDEEKLEAFAELARAHGFRLPKKNLSSKVLADFVRDLQGHPEQRALNQLLLRSMMQAVYSAENVGHYGLAAEFYLHFTSPIRRYPDLMVHRLLKQNWARGERKLPPAEAERETERLERVAAQSSNRERAAMQVEREVNSYYSVLLVKDRIGEEFPATVVSVTDFGFFVQLDQEFVEGLVKAEALGHRFRLDPKLHALVYPQTGRKVRVGQKLTVKLVSVSVARRQIDFEPIAFEGESALKAPRTDRAKGKGKPRPQSRGPRRRRARKA